MDKEVISSLKVSYLASKLLLNVILIFYLLNFRQSERLNHHPLEDLPSMDANHQHPQRNNGEDSQAPESLRLPLQKAD